MRQILTKGDWVFLCGVGFVFLNLITLGYTTNFANQKIEEAQQDVIVLKKAIVDVYDKSVPVRTYLEGGLCDKAIEKWFESFQPAFEEALELCVEVKDAN